MVANNNIPVNASGINSDTSHETQVNDAMTNMQTMPIRKEGNSPSINFIKRISKNAVMRPCAKMVYQSEVRKQVFRMNIP